ncbi:hypothetical protein GOBAR_DD09915 [Gossypium barbadense]|nr:hypothetical protein GOBAR_DD09915 [Gossypium barbadense]
MSMGVQKIPVKKNDGEGLGFSVTPHGISHPYSEEPPLRPVANLGGFTAKDEFNMPLLVIISSRRWITLRRPLDRHVVLTVGALHLVDSVALRSVTSVWHDELALLVKPFLVVNIRGATNSCQYGADLAKQLTAMLQNVLGIYSN